MKPFENLFNNRPEGRCIICGKKTQDMFGTSYGHRVYCHDYVDENGEHDCKLKAHDRGIFYTIMGSGEGYKQMKKRSYTTLDNLWRKAVYSRAGNRCEYCGISGRLNAHHIFSRSNVAVRWDIDNGVCLCVSHHVFGNLSFHKAPAEMLEWIKEKRGEEWYDQLLIRARTVMKPEAAKEKYRAELFIKEMEKAK